MSQNLNNSNHLFIDCRFYLHPDLTLEVHFQDGRTITVSKETVHSFQEILWQIFPFDEDEDENEEEEISEQSD